MGEVGGFMESISSFFGLICSVIVNILYENEITNYLFSFDLQKKLIKIKNDGNISKYKLHDINELDEEQQKDEKKENLNENIINLKSSKIKKSSNDKNVNLSINSNSESYLNMKRRTNIYSNLNDNEIFKKEEREKLQLN